MWYVGSGLTTRRYLHADLGSIVAATNGASAPSINSYDEYGIPGANNVGRFQYTGQIWLAELGMYYYKARIYSPTLGRFLQVDPIGYDDGMNIYAYVGNDPVNATDPSGMESPCVTLNTGCGIDPEEAEKNLETLYEFSGAKDVVEFIKYPWSLKNAGMAAWRDCQSASWESRSLPSLAMLLDTSRWQRKWGPAISVFLLKRRRK